MTNSKKRFFIAVAFLVIAMIVTTTTTYAWFSYNNIVGVTGIDLNVTAQDGLYISSTADGVYKYTLGAADLPTQTEVELKDLTFNTTSNKLVNLLDADAPTGSYYSYDVYIKFNSTYTVKLDTATSSVTSSGTGIDSAIAWTDIAENTYGTHGAYTAGDALDDTTAANAVRVSFTVGDATAPALIWNPNSGAGYHTGNLAGEWNHFMDENKAVPTEQANSNSTAATDITLCTVNADAPVKITVKIWLEGTDGDCFNSIMADDVIATLNFVGTYVAA